MDELITTTIDLLRHAECEGGTIFRGSKDVALSAAGWARLYGVAERQPDWQSIVTSPLRRCRAFAQALAEQRQLPLLVDARLRETSFGRWEGRLVADVWADDFDAVSAWMNDPERHPPPDGEPLDAVRTRALAAFDDALDAARGQHVLLMTHGGLMRTLLGGLLSMPGASLHRLETPYACLTRLRVTHSADGNMLRLVAHNMHAA